MAQRAIQAIDKGVVHKICSGFCLFCSHLELISHHFQAKLFLMLPQLLKNLLKTLWMQGVTELMFGSSTVVRFHDSISRVYPADLSLQA
jgi:hypothetical protein